MIKKQEWRLVICELVPRRYFCLASIIVNKKDDNWSLQIIFWRGQNFYDLWEYKRINEIYFTQQPLNTRVPEFHKTPVYVQIFNIWYFYEGREGGGGGGPNPISQEIVFFQIPAQIPQSQPVLLKLKSHSHFSIFFHESQSQYTKSHFPASKKGKSQLPFYLFTTLFYSAIYNERSKEKDMFVNLTTLN